MDKINKIVNRLIHPKLKATTEMHWRARILTYAHILIAFTVLASFISFANDDTNQFPHHWCFLGILLSVYVFYKWGSFLISGNVITSVVFLAVYATSFHSGGLYSYDLVALVVVPLIALLLADRKSGYMWLSILCIAALYFYIIEIIEPGKYIFPVLLYDTSYFILIIIMIYIFCTSVILVFEAGQSLMRKELQAKQSQLEAKQAQLEEAKNQLEASNKELEMFAHVASHDLRQPLRTVNTFSKLLQKDLQDNLNPKAKELLDFIITGSDDMKKLVNSILEHARLNGKQKHKGIEVRSFLVKILLKLQQQISESRADIQLKDLPKSMHGDEIQLGLVFQNLISNAIKFRSTQRPLQILITGKTLKTHYQFTIQDNGIGIEPEFQKSMFNPLTKTNTKQNITGTGMGLATCKKIIEKHQGTIWAVSQSQQGTSFIFTIANASVEQKCTTSLPDQSAKKHST